MLGLLVRSTLFMPLYNLGESFVDNVLRDKVAEPEIGSVLYCDLAFGFAEHSGIYVGNERIVHLTGDGVIEEVCLEGFLSCTTAISIYVSCSDATPVGSHRVATRARSMVGYRRSYNFLLDNCHQFSAGCLTGNFDNTHNFLWMLKEESNRTLGSNSWRVWEL